jgi:predicted enzyme related to lactoylglutathione lyase
MANVFQQHGAFSWSELMTTNVAAAKDFYARLFGWQMRDQPVPGGMGEMIYTVVKAGDQEVGGMMAMPPGMEGMPPCWGGYVTVDNVDESVKLVEELGGQVKLPPMDIPDVGRFAMIQDPQGAVLSIITYTMPSEACA